MALGWKILIPISLVWIMMVAVVRTLRARAIDGLGVVAGRRRARSSACCCWCTCGAALRASRPAAADGRPALDRVRRVPGPAAFPCQGGPPMSKRHISSTPSPASASRSRRCSRSRSPSSIRRSRGRWRRAITAAISSTGTPTAWRSASAASCAPGRARPTRSTSRAPTTPRRNASRPASATGGSTRSTICAASAAGCASRPARPGR